MNEMVLFLIFLVVAGAVAFVYAKASTQDIDEWANEDPSFRLGWEAYNMGMPLVEGMSEEWRNGWRLAQFFAGQSADR